MSDSRACMRLLSWQRDDERVRGAEGVWHGVVRLGEALQELDTGPVKNYGG